MVSGIELNKDLFSIIDVDNNIEDLVLKISEADIPIDSGYSINGLFVFPDEHYFGQIEIPVYVEDDLGLSSDLFNCTININGINDFPYFETDIGDIVIDEDQVYSEQWTSIINPGVYEEDNIFFNITFVDNSLVSIAFLPSEGVLNITPNDDVHGTTQFTVRITDDGEGFLYYEQDYTLTINPVNDPPYFYMVSDSLEVDEDCCLIATPLDSIYIFNIHPGGGDGIFKEANDSLWFTINNYDNDLFNELNQPKIEIVDNTNGLLSFSVVDDYNGNTNFSIILNDNGSSSYPFNTGSSNEDILNVQINQVNDRPLEFPIYESLHTYQSDQSTFTDDNVYFRFPYQPFYVTSDLVSNKLRFKWARINNLDVDIDPIKNKDILMDNLYYQLEMFSLTDTIYLDTLIYDPVSTLDTISVDIDLTLQHYNLDLTGNTLYNWRVVTKNYQTDIFGNDPSYISNNENYSFRTDLILPTLDIIYLYDDIFIENFDLYIPVSEEIVGFSNASRPLKLWIYYNSVVSNPEIIFPTLKDELNNIYFSSYNFDYLGDISFVYQMRDQAENINQGTHDISFNMINPIASNIISFDGIVDLTYPLNAVNELTPCLISNTKIDSVNNLNMIGDAIKIYPYNLELNHSAILSFDLDIIPDDYNLDYCSIYYLDNNNWVISDSYIEDNKLKSKINNFGTYVIFYNENMDSSSYPNEYILIGNYPNPFNPETIIDFYLPEDNYINLSIFNIKGQKIRTIYQGQLNKGYQSLKWDGKNDQNVSLPSGLYIVNLKYDNKIIQNKVVKLK